MPVSRFYSFAQRWLPRIAVSMLVLPLCGWLYLQIDQRTLWGLRVRGQAIPRTKHPEPFLEQVAQHWAEQELSIVTGAHLTRAKRAELGGKLNVARLSQQALLLGHSGNPLLDLWIALEAAIGGRELLWAPQVDRITLGRYVRAVRNIVEKPPVAGSRDDAGWSVAGVPGITLDTLETADALERALRSGTMRLEIEMRRVPPPATVAIGSPDAVIYDEGSEAGIQEGQRVSVTDEARLRAARPQAFLPEQGCEPMDPPYEHFCQGPRKVAMPFGTDAELADTLELGTVQAVGRLLNYGPRSDWVAAAGGPVAQHMNMLWPTTGQLWRRFGYVRRPPFENLLHRGVDVGAAKGTPLQAVNKGIVAYSDNGVRGYGNLLVIVHDDASVTFSAHCRAIYVFPGQRVRRGQIVGEVGDTGLARGAHVHWEYHVRGQAVDPYSRFVD